MFYFGGVMFGLSDVVEIIAAIQSHIPHFNTLQKFTERVNGITLERIISSFIDVTNIRQIFIGVDSSGFKATHASQYYTERTELRRRKYIKVSSGADVLK